MDAETEAGFEINGKTYPVPTLDTLNMDEAQVLYDYSGLAVEDFVVDPDATDEEMEKAAGRLKNPGLIRALMHIAYQRGNEKIPAGKVRELVGRANLLSSLQSFYESGADDDPPASTTEPEQPSPSGSVESSESSGNDSTTDSDEPVVRLAATGTGR